MSKVPGLSTKSARTMDIKHETTSISLQIIDGEASMQKPTGVQMVDIKKYQCRAPLQAHGTAY